MNGRRAVSLVPYGKHYRLTLTCGHQSVVASTRRDIIDEWNELGDLHVPVTCSKCERARAERIQARWGRGHRPGDVA